MDGPVKIGVLTFHRCINYGSYWQARCLVEGLGALGHHAELLDHASARVDRAEWRCALRPVPGQTGDRAAYRRKMLRFFEAFATLPLSPRFPLDAPRFMDEYEAIVVGSDEVWNLSHPWYGGVPLFYGQGLRTQRALAYAASFGHHDTSSGLDPAWARRLRDFEAIAVRDEASRALVAAAIGADVDVVLDPCLAFPPGFDAYESGTEEHAYVALYGHGFSSGFANAVRGWAHRRGLPIVSIGYRNDWADRQWIEAGPLEFAPFIANADAVVTNFFHGCVFALRHRRPFVCEASWYRGTKLRCLMQQVGGERHLLAPAMTPDDIAGVLDVPISACVDARIERLRLASREFLREAVRAQAAVS